MALLFQYCALHGGRDVAIIGLEMNRETSSPPPPPRYPVDPALPPGNWGEAQRVRGAIAKEEAAKRWGRTLQLGFPSMFGAMCLSVTLLSGGGLGLEPPFLAGVCTVLFILPAYVLADVIRRAWGLPPWGILVVAAGMSLALGFLFSVGIHGHHIGNTFGIGLGTLFLPTLPFGLAYVGVLYFRARQGL